jgi:hypothetical protein
MNESFPKNQGGNVPTEADYYCPDSGFVRRLLDALMELPAQLPETPEGVQ